MFQVCGEAAVEDREWIKLGVGGGCGGRYEGMKVGGGSSRGGREGREGRRRLGAAMFNVECWILDEE